jgi:uncharacterized protein involved in cysteine biosynthesis
MFKIIRTSALDLLDPNMRIVFLKTVSISIIVILSVAMVIWGLFNSVQIFELNFLNKLISWAVGIVLFITASAVLGPLMAVIGSIYSEEIAHHVEKKHYPNRVGHRFVGVAESIKTGGRLLLKSLIVNILFTPIYIVAGFFPIISVLIFFGVNGYLLSRELFEIVASRHLRREDRVLFWKANRGGSIFIGVLIVCLSAVPLLNLISAMLGVVLTTHFFQYRAAAGRVQQRLSDG